MLKSSAICIKTHCNMPQIGTRFAPNNGVIRIKLQRFMNEITHQMLWRDKIKPVFQLFHFYLLISQSVKSEHYYLHKK